MTNHAKDAFNKIWDLAKHCEVLDDGDLYPALYFKDDKNTPDDELIEDMYEERVFIPIIQAAIDADRAERDKKIDEWFQRSKKNAALVDELEDRIKQYDDNYKATMDEKCSGDQLHCTCVPVLKVRIAELEERLRDQTKQTQRAAEYYIADVREHLAQHKLPIEIEWDKHPLAQNVLSIVCALESEIGLHKDDKKNYREEIEHLRGLLKPFAEIFEKWTDPQTSALHRIIMAMDRGDLIEMFRTALSGQPQEDK